MVNNILFTMSYKLLNNYMSFNTMQSLSIVFVRLSILIYALNVKLEHFFQILWKTSEYEIQHPVFTNVGNKWRKEWHVRYDTEPGYVSHLPNIYTAGQHLEITEWQYYGSL